MIDEERREVIKDKVRFLKEVVGLSEDEFCYDGSIGEDKTSYKEWKENNLDWT